MCGKVSNSILLRPDDAFLAKVIELLKHLGLYIPLLMILLLPSCMLGYDMNSNLTGKFDPYFIDKSFDYLVKRQDVKVVKDEGLTLIMVLSIILALWTASMSIAEEIEGRTALTVLSKPISRRSFILGKFLGIIGPVALLFIVLGALFLATVSYKVVYDARESAQEEPTRQECRESMVQIVPGLVLAFMEAVVFVAISVAISTRLPMLPNLIICLSVYVLGHLVPMLANSAVGKLELVAPDFPNPLQYPSAFDQDLRANPVSRQKEDLGLHLVFPSSEGAFAWTLVGLWASCSSMAGS